LAIGGVAEQGKLFFLFILESWFASFDFGEESRCKF